MKQLNILKSLGLCSIMLAGLTSCEDFLDRPTIDSYVVDGFYQSDEQCRQAVNTIYNSPWYDFQRGFFKIGEVLSGNYYWGSSPYLSFTINSTDEDLVNMSASLWSVNAYCNSVIENIDMKSGPDVSEEVKRNVKGEAIVWKSMAYFYLVRCFGGVPIIHNNSELISAGGYNNLKRATAENVYDYIIMNLEKAIEWLPEKDITKNGRFDKYTAYALLSKVYLTKSGLGQSGSRNSDDLAKAASYADKVITQSGRQLLPNYSDIFRLENNVSDEAIISWRWVVSNIWTSQNTLQSDLAMVGFSEYGDTWGGYAGPSVDLQDAFNENAMSLTRNNFDERRKATMMMYGDTYDYFWSDKNGFDYNYFCMEYSTGPQEFQCPTGANNVKHLVGNNSDHVAGIGTSMARMATSLATHLLRLSDVYLIYAEAVIVNNGSTSDAKALDAFNAVRGRSVKSETPKTVITWEDVWKERRLELACEGDRWYDYVRLHYYDPQRAINELKSQRRSFYNGLGSYYKSEVFNAEEVYYDPTPDIPNVTSASFELPFPDTDLTMNPNLKLEPEHDDISKYSY